MTAPQRRPEIIARRPRWTLIAAGVFAGTGLTVAAWVAAPYLGFGRTAHVVGADPALPAGAQHTDAPLPGGALEVDRAIPAEAFRPLADRRDALRAMEDLVARITEQSTDVEGLARLDTRARENYAREVMRVVTPFLTGEYEAFLRVAELTDPSATGDEARHDREKWEEAVRYFRLAPIAVDRAETLPLTFEGSSRPVTDDMMLLLRMGMVHPSMSTRSIRVERPSDWRARADSFETRIPLLIENPAGDRRLTMLGVALARDPATGQWRPAETRVYTDLGDEYLHTGLSKDEMERLAQLLPGGPPL